MASGGGRNRQVHPDDHRRRHWLTFGPFEPLDRHLLPRRPRSRPPQLSAASPRFSSRPVLLVRRVLVRWSSDGSVSRRRSAGQDRARLPAAVRVCSAGIPELFARCRAQQRVRSSSSLLLHSCILTALGCAIADPAAPREPHRRVHQPALASDLRSFTTFWIVASVSLV